jgi:hypothetical protein
MEMKRELQANVSLPSNPLYKRLGGLKNRSRYYGEGKFGKQINFNLYAYISIKGRPAYNGKLLVPWVFLIDVSYYIYNFKDSNCCCTNRRISQMTQTQN